MLTIYCIFVAKMKQDTMKKYLFILWTIVMTVTVNAQIMNPVHFTSELKMGEGAEAEIVFHATIDNGWHVYSTDLGDDGPIEATFNVVKMDGAEPVGKLIPKGKEIKKMDKLFDLELKFFENEATFVQETEGQESDCDCCTKSRGTCSE